MKRDHVTSYARIGPTRVRVRTQGQGEPLLLVMGIGGSLDMWEPLAEHLPGRKLVMFDFPGTGESTISWLPPTMAHNAFFLRQLLRRLDLQRVDVLGYSWGGLLAQQLAIQHPRCVNRLILACTGLGVVGVPANPGVALRLLTPRRYYSPAYLAKIAPTTYGGKFRRDESLVLREAERRIEHPPSLTGYVAQLLAAATYSSIPGLPFVAAPTLILAGDDDPIVHTGNQHILHALMRDSTLRVFSDAGHLVLVDSPEVVGPVIEEFLVRTARRNDN